MGKLTGISWCHHTFNPWEGCTRLSPACDNCFAAERAHRFGNDRLWNGELRRTSSSNWQQPLKWDREAAAAGERRRVFCASLCDVFDNQAPDEWRDNLWRLIEATPNLTWMLLTKRPQNVPKMLPTRWRNITNGEAAQPDAPRNIWLGVTAEDQERADQRVAIAARIGFILQWPVFVSYEPALGPVDWTKIVIPGTQPGQLNALTGSPAFFPLNATRLGTTIDTGSYMPLNVIIAGGESGPAARPSHPDWFRSTRDQCADAGTVFHFKQWGLWTPSRLGEEMRLLNVRPNGDWEPSAGICGLDEALMTSQGSDDRRLDGMMHDRMPA
ncbi:MAG: DUF5131 family protein [Sphingobium sp.]|uniref:DUF5131 family protein n=1 Tax=Sphingobium sp. TaxID=1912891 RepID=UPI003BB12887